VNWFSIFRLGLVQLCIGSSVVIPLSTLNRLMKVELALPATIAGFLIALHYAVQLTRVNWGHLSDKSQNRSQWIVLGMLILGIGGILASASIPLIENRFSYGIILALLSYSLIGFGVGAAGTPLLALLATYSSKSQKGFAASITFLMMILGLAITGITVGTILDPYSHQKLLKITSSLAIITIIISFLSLRNLERSLQNSSHALTPNTINSDVPILEGIKKVWMEREARLFTIFIFISMGAFSMQDPILEPFAGEVFGFTVGESTKLDGFHKIGTLIGIISIVLCLSKFRIGFGSLSIVKNERLGSEKLWLITGCLFSALSLFIISLLALTFTEPNLLNSVVFIFGISNGVFTAGVLGTMLHLASRGSGDNKEGTRMGIWGAAQAYATMIAVFFSTLLVDILGLIMTSLPSVYGIVFLTAASFFIASAYLGSLIIKSDELNPNQNILQSVN
jgi:BCD family chlorophyll transporter-like MFS transporter|tara:strand:- start:380 stop:1732 length:1353 start_codon:yes stop_codon:yes gene_type:complete